MPEPSDPILEYLHAIRASIARLEGQFATLSAEMRAVRQQYAGVQTLQDQDHVDIAELKQRVDRIERRLDIVE